jgi:hypothetical protein
MRPLSPAPQIRSFSRLYHAAPHEPIAAAVQNRSRPVVLESFRTIEPR